ncbi:DUF930 domain-containing protein [Roseibium polysiphoniae]|uniref:DUF930 domain-containing protein n=1 Tax=Roseibium polysiphoniae TaxID=2571221 RepID=A0ABR9C954_9HYPH|nr:DUF930 domain-containing protein [Roseibium polysiphoniae]MBD8876420.1 DUF930 domain-containing protein [Roseibium polysiphoniae]
MDVSRDFLDREQLEAPITGILLAVLLHLLAAVLLLIFERHSQKPPPPVASMEVELIDRSSLPTDAPAATALPSEAAPEDVMPRGELALPAPSPPARRRDPPSLEFPPDGLTHATQFYAQALLTSPRGEQARSVLRQSTSDEQMVQVCNSEAMEQLAASNAGQVPDKVIAYAREEISLNGLDVEAPGAAIRRAGRWYELHYNCRVILEGWEVQSFAYAVGEEIPRWRWEALSLPYD